MLYITQQAESDAGITLKVEGRIVAAWVSILKRVCLASLEDQSLVLDFSSVTFIDSPGVQMLRQLPPARASIINCPSLIENLLKGS